MISAFIWCKFCRRRHWIVGDGITNEQIKIWMQFMERHWTKNEWMPECMVSLNRWPTHLNALDMFSGMGFFLLRASNETMYIIICVYCFGFSGHFISLNTFEILFGSHKNASDAIKTRITGNNWIINMNGVLGRCRFCWMVHAIWCDIWDA